jgi:hypothetical protein
VDASYALATAAKSWGGRSKPTQNTIFKGNIPKAAIRRSEANGSGVRIAVNFVAEREYLLWVKLVDLTVYTPSQLTAWEQANFEIYRLEARGQQRLSKYLAATATSSPKQTVVSKIVPF